MAKLELNPNRFFDPDKEIRKIAFELYEQVKDLPIISPHGHVDPKILAENTPFPDPAELILIPDHYIFRMLYSQGIPLEAIGIPSKENGPVGKDHRKIWQIFADHYYLFAGTPTGAWLSHEFVEVFGIKEKLESSNALKIYDEIQEKLNSPEFLPRALYDRFNIEVLSTTDGAYDTLEHHKNIIESDWSGRVIPCFRPDAVINMHLEGWNEEIKKLEKASGISINSFSNFISAIEDRREYFKSMGATSTDQGVFTPFTNEMTKTQIESLFQRALKVNTSEKVSTLFSAHMLMEMARMSVEDGLVMQIHPGSFRNHNEYIFNHFGPDKGCDIPVQTEYTCNMYALLNKFGNDPRLSLIVFTLDETSYSRELAPLAGHYPAMKLGPAWWFHDSVQGMTRYKEQVSETAGIYNTVGFNDDTRAFPSIPARHDLSRRIDSNFLARLVARQMIDMDEALKMGRALAYDLAKAAYKL